MHVNMLLFSMIYSTYSRTTKCSHSFNTRLIANINTVLFCDLYCYAVRTGRNDKHVRGIEPFLKSINESLNSFLMHIIN